MKLPKTRTENLLEQNLAGETLIYDLNADKAYNLNETSTIVYKACCQDVTFEELKLRSQFTDDLIYLALDELKRNNLLADAEYISPFAGISRREVIKKVGFASMVALPIITGLISPTAANAASNCPDPFSANGIPNGCRTGGNINDVTTCAGQSDADRTALCQAFGGAFTNRCTSGNAVYAGDCATTGPNSSTYGCVCAA
jgi:hypothetical protein